MIDSRAQGSKKIQSLIRGLRHENLIATLFACAVGALSFLAFVVERLQHRTTTSPNDHSAMMGLTLLMFLAISHGFLALRIAKVAEALAEMQDPAASPLSVGQASSEKAAADELL